MQHADAPGIAARQKATDLVGLIGFLLVSFGAAGIGGLFTSSGLGDWYDSLRKPPWTPPDAVFGPVWTVLYAAMGVAAWLVWRRAGWRGARVALGLFGVQLVLNAAWSGLFFGLRRPDLAAIEIVVLWVAILATILAFARVSRTAAGLMVPYLLWVTFASALNLAIWRLNLP
jgi:benzodiazapine receptor